MFLAALSLIVGLVSAQQLPQTIPTSIRDFSGGMVDNVDPVNLKSNESPDLLNVKIDDPVGSIKPRSGFLQCGTIPSGNTPTGLYEYTRSDGSRRLIATDNANIYSTPDCVAWTTIQTGLSSSAQVHFKTIRDKLWMVNGSTWPRTWDGTTTTVLDGVAATTPDNVPYCSYIEFWKERVWCGAPSGSPSAVNFSALTSADGSDLDPSTGTLSWPAINVFQIDQNAGSRLYGLKAYRNRLYAFKDNGIWEIGFDSDFNNFVRKTYSSVGSRYQSSIYEVDGILHFVGRDGIYAFDGDNAIRISEKIKNKFATLNQPIISQNYKIWDTQTQLGAGTFTQTSSLTVIGSVVTTGAESSVTNADFELGNLTDWTQAVSGTSCGTGEGVPCPCTGTGFTASNTSPIAGVYSGAIKYGLCIYDSGGATCGGDNPEGTPTHTYSILDGDSAVVLGPTTISVGVNTVDLTALTTNYIRFRATGSNGTGGYSGTMAPITVNTSAALTFQASSTQEGSGSNCETFFQTLRIDDVTYNAFASTGAWVSEQYNAVTVSTWGAFNANSSLNGGSIIYQIRVGKNTADISTKTWTTITPGTAINGTTSDVYVQTSASFTTVADALRSPELTSMQVSWNSGGSNTQQIYSFGNNNSLWISASSGTASTNNMVFQRAKNPLDAWMLHDLQIGPMAAFNDVFYAAASTHSAIYRMDYGTNDNGRAIPWHWTSRDENYGLPNNAKQMREMVADFRNNAACNIRVGFVQDANTTYCVGNTPAPNANLVNGVGSRRLFFNGGPAYTYRFKVCDDTLDQVPVITGLGSYATPIQRRGD